MTDRRRLLGRLYSVRGRIIRIKRAAKLAAGPRKDNWPDELRQRYEFLTNECRRIQEWIGQSGAAA
jgi:hypothetical protein